MSQRATITERQFNICKESLVVRNFINILTITREIDNRDTFDQTVSTALELFKHQHNPELMENDIGIQNADIERIPAVMAFAIKHPDIDEVVGLCRDKLSMDEETAKRCLYYGIVALKSYYNHLVRPCN